MVMDTYIHVVGLQGVGKSRFISEVYPDSQVCDIEPWWDRAPYEEGWKNARWTKDRQLEQIVDLLEDEEPLIIGESTGVTEAGINHVRHIISMVQNWNYHTIIVYLQPKAEHTFRQAIKDNQGAKDMFEAWISGGPGKFMIPCAANLGHDVHVVTVDHADWTWHGKLDEYGQEPEFYRLFSAEERELDREWREDQDEMRRLTENIP
jgi:hypothetical protein